MHVLKKKKIYVHMYYTKASNVRDSHSVYGGLITFQYQYPTNEEEEKEKKAGRCTAM